MSGLLIAIQMDPLDSLNLAIDSSLVMAREAINRGHDVYYYVPGALVLENGKLSALAQRLTFAGMQPVAETPVKTDLRDMDVILIRQDPPFDMAYITSTHLLEHVQPDVLVVNDPAAIRNAPEKLLVTFFPDLTPPTLITADPAAISAFHQRHGDIILKPLYASGGAGVFHINVAGENLNAVIELLMRHYPQPLVAQRYLPEIIDGDKRILLIEGKPIGAVLRLPAAGEKRANIHAGGTAVKAKLTERDHEICDTIGPILREMGLVFCGIDVIGNCLIEINATSPTMMTHLAAFDGISPAALFWDAVEARLSA